MVFISEIDSGSALRICSFLGRWVHTFVVHNVLVGVYETCTMANGEMSLWMSIASFKDPGIVEAEVGLVFIEVVNIEPWNNTRLSHESFAWEKSRLGGPTRLVENHSTSSDPG